MSKPSLFQFPERNRVLHQVEKNLLTALLNSASQTILEAIDTVLVKDMNDGGMGSIRFMSSNEESQSFGSVLAEAEYIDEDGVLIIISIYADKREKLYEIDFWQVVFSLLRRYPTPEKLDVKL